jgi:D-alanine transaminase
MTNELIWLNGEVIRMSDARIGVEDRGYQFADGVYEVIRLYDGRPFTLSEHLERLERSAAGIRLAVPLAGAQLEAEVRKFLPQAGIAEGMIYMQLTRGVAPRNHVWRKDAGTTLLFYARPLEPLPAIERTPAVKLLTAEDERWQRCWIKSIALLPNVLAKNLAAEQGADEAVFVDGGRVTECSASNFYCVIGGKLVTCPIGPKVLPGITRAVLLECAAQLGIAVEERAPTLADAKSADEVFITSTTREISPVGTWDGQKVGHSLDVTQRLHRALKERVARAV